MLRSPNQLKEVQNDKGTALMYMDDKKGEVTGINAWLKKNHF